MDGVVDTVAGGSVIYSNFTDITRFEAEQVLSKGLEPDRLIARHLIRDVAINLGGRNLSLNLSVNILLNMFCSDLCEVMMCEIVCIN